MEKRFLSMQELASYIGVAYKTLRNWKCSNPGRLPPHIAIASGKYDTWRFDIAEVDAWMLRNSLGR